MTEEPKTRRATFTLAEALAALRERAAGDPGQWKGAESEGAGLVLEWVVGPAGVDTPEAVRVTRRYVPPVSEDLERTAAALPREVEIGPIVVDPRARTLFLGLRPRGARTPAERCSRCGASPRFGTRLYGDAQLCAVCTMFGEGGP